MILGYPVVRTPVIASVPVVYAQSLGTQIAKEIFDLSTKRGKELYNKAVEPLTIDLHLIN